MRNRFVRAAAALTAAACLLPNAAVARPDVWATATYDRSIPALEAVLGHGIGDEVTASADIRRYFEALQAASPTRVQIGDYGRTWQGRPLYWVAIGSERNIARLEDIKAGMRALADPRLTDAAEARRLIADLPAVIWLGHSVHGNEIAPADAAMATARHLLAAGDDPVVRAAMENTIVVLAPNENPDGRERFVQHFDLNRGLVPDSDPLSAERNERWPGGRANGALFDLNRDWFAQTQPETQGHVRALLDWRPQIFVDLHEMGTSQTYFFAPESPPVNPLQTASQLQMRALIGRNNGRRFDEAGLDYFTREWFDSFYPGYGDSWPSYLGVISMTYEGATTRGLIGRRPTGEEITYFDTVRSQALASLATIETAANERQRLLREFYDYHVSALGEGRAQGAYILARPAYDPAAADKLAGLLVRQGLEVGRANGGFTACGVSYPAGTYVIDLNQPLKRMAEVLLSPQIDMDPAYIAEQEGRRARNLNDNIYDVTAWSLPLSYNTPVSQCRLAPTVARTAIGPELIRAGAVSNPDGAVGFLVPAGSAGMRFLAAALRDGLTLRSPDEPFVHGGRTYPGGTLILTRHANGPDLTQKVTELAASTGTEVVGVDDAWVTDGPNFGSLRAKPMYAPRILLAWDEPTSSAAAGHIRFMLEREYGYSVTVMRAAQMANADLSRYQVVILPSGGDYGSALGRNGVTNLRDWTRRGGVLIGVGRGTRFLADPASGLLSARLETAAETTPPARETAEAARVPGRIIGDDAAYAQLIGQGAKPPYNVSGVLARARVDNEHWLGAGVAPEVNVLVEGGDIYTPLTLADGVNVVRLRGADDLFASGYLWAENRQQLAYKPIAMVQPLGRGQIVGFTQNVVTRGYMDGLNVLFLNAIFRGTAHTTPTR